MVLNQLFDLKLSLSSSSSFVLWQCKASNFIFPRCGTPVAWTTDPEKLSGLCTFQDDLARTRKFNNSTISANVMAK